MSNELCPCCGRHCPLDDLHCERGREYAKTGVIPSHGEERGDKCRHEHCHHEHHHKHDGEGHHRQ